jgi:signal transduction histidine kinase
MACSVVKFHRKRAAAISASGPDERLPVPLAKDELQRLGLTLNEMLARIEMTLARERRFVDDASHELRTPLTLHKTELELALRHGGSEEELRAAIASGLEEIDRLVQLAEDLLVVARSEEGKLTIALEPLPVADLLAIVGKRFRARVAASGRTLVVDGSADLLINADRLRLEQALSGMVDNALRHGDGEVPTRARRSRRCSERPSRRRRRLDRDPGSLKSWTRFTVISSGLRTSGLAIDFKEDLRGSKPRQ